jgi:hypothetical protein
MTDMVVKVAISVAVAAAMARTAEHRAGPSHHRAYRAADHRAHWTANRGPGGDASESTHGLRWRSASAKCEAS